MLNFGTFFLWALAACFLWRGSLAKDVQSHYVCLLDDPSPNHCDSFCLNELRPLLKQVIKGQGQGVTCEADNETKEKLGSLVGQEARLRRQFHGVEAKMEGRLQEVQARLQGVEAKMESQIQEVKVKMEGVENNLEGQLQGVQTKLEAKLEGQQAVLTRMAEAQVKLEGSLLAVQTSFETNLQAVLNQLQAVSKQIDVAKEETAELVRKEIQKTPPGFERIGSRYFKIVKEDADWTTAERKCREMGGYLASFRNEEEINAVTKRLRRLVVYWLGLNDRDSEGHFVSVASNKPAKFFEWGEGQPDNEYNNEHCVYLFKGKMWDGICDITCYFICQSDNEI